MNSCKLDKHKKCSKVCLGCGIIFIGRVGGQFGRKFCSLLCYYNHATLDKSPSWKGGKRFDAYGYIECRLLNKTYRKEHILVVEKVLGRKLNSNECVHHINGDKADNRNLNLLVCSKSYHASLEFKMAQLYKQEHFGIIIRKNTESQLVGS